MAKSYAEKIIETKIMIDGLKEFKDSLPLGIKGNAAEDMEKLRKEIEDLNSEQESLKAELKKKTEAISLKFAELDKLYSDTRKRIKLDIEKTLWRKFGIEDKR